MRDAFADLVLGSTCLGCGRPGRPVCPACTTGLPASPEDAFAAGPDPRPAGLVPTLAAAEYGGLVRALVVRHKEEQAFGLVVPLARLLAIAVRAALDLLPPALATGVRPVLVPVPSRPEVVRARGHDPLARIVRRTARAVRGLPVVPLLRQTRRTGDQSGLDAERRAENLAGALAVRPLQLWRVQDRRDHAGRPLVAVVCDDVVTTGATAREAQRALEEAGVPVLAVATVAATRLRRSR